jgi:hypothetical protein
LRFFARREADDDFKYVLKFKGRSRCKALIAELIGGRLRVLKLQIPELVYANLDEAFGRTEADEEIQDLEPRFKFTHFLSGAINFDPVVTVDSKRLPKLYG